MEGTSEESDNLTGTAHTMAVSQTQKQQRTRNLLKLAVFLLLASSILLAFAAAVKEKALQECQQSLQVVADQELNPDGEQSEVQVTGSTNIDDEAPSDSTAPPPVPAGLPFPQIKSKQAILESEYKSGNNPVNLWVLPRQQKIALLSRVKSAEQEQLGFTPFLKGKDQQVQSFFADYEKRSEVLDWATWQITETEYRQIGEAVKATLEERNKKLNELIATYTRKYTGKSGYMPDQNKGITYEQFLQTLQLRKLTGSKIFASKESELEQIEVAEWQSYVDKYGIEGYTELPVCIVMPTYNNKVGLRYVWSVQSLLQQNYKNYRVIIIDDNSKDGTGEATGTYLKWRGVDPKRFTVISGKERRTALENIYYGAHKYCDYGQVFMIFDGDDELFGRQALKVINALYQRHQYYLIYSQFISYNPSNRREVLDIGISEDFPYFIKARNSYRTFKHSYSQLRTVLSDLILLEPVSSLKLKNGKFFGLLYDNALFYPAFEMSCTNFLYLPEIFYWYNINTGANDWKMAKTPFYKENRFGIELQKPFSCIETQLLQAREQ